LFWLVFRGGLSGFFNRLSLWFLFMVFQNRLRLRYLVSHLRFRSWFYWLIRIYVLVVIFWFRWLGGRF
jgi:hypothetical protein